MRIFGLIGYPLSHSFSQRYFTEKFVKSGFVDYQYKNFEIPDVRELPHLVAVNPDLEGLNITIPYKEQVIQYLDAIDPEADKIKAVNTIKITRNGNKVHLKGFNTDAFGFEASLKPLLMPHHNKALILGTGGASKAVAYVLEKLNIEYKYVSRNPKAINHLGYDMLEARIMENYHIIINSSPLGTYPNVESSPPIPYHLITSKHLLHDLVYNPPETAFMIKGQEQGAVVKNGYDMLVGQAEKAWEIWNRK
ncbi:MAG: shikimate dehydrogenase [Bacteroidales bacterium]|nr:shikimate dehydrogenase [Bacteroidales bacterium]